MRSRDTSRSLATSCFQAVPLLVLFWPMMALGVDLSLGEVLRKARLQNLEVQASRDLISVEEHDYEAAQGRYLPKIDLESRYTHLNEAIELDVGQIRSAIISGSQVAAAVAGGPEAGATTAQQLNQSLPPFTLKMQDQNYFNAALTLTQPIYAGGRLSANEVARYSELQIAKLESSDTAERIIVTAAQSYFNIRLAELNLSVRVEILEGLKAHQKISARLLAEGQITRINKMNADLKVKEAEAAHVKASYELRLARNALSSLLNEDIGTANLTTELYLARNLEGASSYRLKASKSNKRLKISKVRALMLDQKHESARADYLPSVYAFGRYELYKESLTATEPEWLVGVGLRMNIYSGGETRESVAAIVAEKTASSKQIEVAKQSIETSVDKAYSDLASSSEQFEFLEAAVKFAEESVKLMNAAFRGGTSRSIDVTDGYNSLGQAKLARLKCLSDYNFAFFQLKRLTGEVEKMQGQGEDR